MYGTILDNIYTNLEINVHICRMKAKNQRLIILISSIFLLLVSCKKEEEQTKKFMTGSVEFDFPSYVMTGQQVTSYASGITSPKNPVYAWVSSNLGIANDTVVGQSLTITMPTNPGEYTIRALAFADGYYNSSKDHNIVVISISGGSVEGLATSEQVITDPRDSEQYQVNRYGSLMWFIENLRYAGDTANTNPELRDTVGYAYENSDAIGKIFGRLYSWNEATGSQAGQGLAGGPQGVCPPGWSIPTEEDWLDLANAVSPGEYEYFNVWSDLGNYLTAPIAFNDSSLWPYSPNNPHSNSSMWNGIPSGNYNNFADDFENVGQYGMWWSSIEDESGTMGNYRYIFYNNSSVNQHFVDKDSYGVSVRCVKLAQ